MSVIAVSLQNLSDRLNSVSDAADQELLIDKQLNDMTHNGRARLLRNGLMVVAFTSLEDFIRARAAEILRLVSRSVVRFDDLPEPLRLASTFEAMRAAHVRATMARRSGLDPFAIIQDAAREIASTQSGSLQLSQYSLGYSGSNVNSNEISDMLGCLHIKDGWGEITRISSRVGFGSIPLKAEYESAMQLRNAAAHDPRADTQPGDLKAFCEKALAIALGFDLLGSRAGRLLKEGQADILRGKIEIAKTLTFRFLDETEKGYSEKVEGTRKAHKVHGDLDSAWKLAFGRCTQHHQPLIERTGSKVPIRWATPDLA